jgi:hypothetical protein
LAYPTSDLQHLRDAYRLDLWRYVFGIDLRAACASQKKTAVGGIGESRERYPIWVMRSVVARLPRSAAGVVLLFVHVIEVALQVAALPLGRRLMGGAVSVIGCLQ